MTCPLLTSLLRRRYTAIYYRIHALRPSVASLAKDKWAEGPGNSNHAAQVQTVLLTA